MSARGQIFFLLPVFVKVRCICVMVHLTSCVVLQVVSIRDNLALELAAAQSSLRQRGQLSKSQSLNVSSFEADVASFEASVGGDSANFSLAVRKTRASLFSPVLPVLPERVPSMERVESIEMETTNPFA